MGDLNHYEYTEYSSKVKKTMNNATKEVKVGTKLILLALGIFVVTVLVMMLTACASVTRDGGGAPDLGNDAPTQEETLPDSKCPDVQCPMPPDPECPMPPMQQPDTCDQQLVCHGGRCYERCCSDADCPSDLSCRWGVCRTGQGWGD